MTITNLKAKLLAAHSHITPKTLLAWNKWLALLHLAQGIAILILGLGAAKSFPVQTSYVTLNPLATEVAGSPVFTTATHRLFDINLAYLVAAFFFIAAIAHALIATVYRKRYEAGLQQGINRARWIEYALSASTMMVVIGMVSGVADLSSLIMLFALVAIVSLTGLIVEVYHQGKAKPDWLIYVIGGIAGVVPWLVGAVYLWGANMFGGGSVPAYVYWIYGSLLLLFAAFAVNMYLQYKKVGPWKKYLYGERMYMVLSLAAKTLLAWQVLSS